MRALQWGFVAAVFIAIATGAAAGFWFHHSLWGTRSPTTVEIEIEEGSTARDILAQLHGTDLMPSEFAGRLYLKDSSLEFMQGIRE